MKFTISRAGVILRRIAKWHVLIIILVGFAAVSLGQYKSRNSPRTVLQLTEPKLTGQVSFEQVLAKQTSVLKFFDQPLSISQIGQLAWAGQGVIDRQTGLRTAPSPGAIHPMELYFATKDGVFVYNPENHTLEQTSDQDVRIRLAAATSEPQAVADAGCDIVIAGSTRKGAVKYGKQARKYIMLEGGSIAQNIRLEAVSWELGSVPVADFDMREVSLVCRLPKGSEPVYIIGVGYPAAAITEGAEAARALSKKAALIVAAANFRDEELFETRLALYNAGVETVIASSRTGPVTGMRGGVAEAAIPLNDLRVDDFDAIVFIGGAGAAEYMSGPVAVRIAKEAAEKGKVLAAIGIAPVVLANAGVLGGVKATSFLSERERLERAGAEFTGTPVERDGLIVTAGATGAGNLFGRAIADALGGS